MILHVAGIFHFDPLCRKRLAKWLKQIASMKRNSPLFIAVEWSRRLFKRIKDEQRPLFRQLAQKKWPHIQPALLNALELSLGYEADTHESIFKVETLWLDDGRENELGVEDKITNYAKNRLQLYESFLNRQAMPSKAMHALQLLSEEAIARASGDKNQELSDPRDSKWSDLLIDRYSCDKNDWAIVVAGASHASLEIKGSMVNQIRSRNTLKIDCESVKV
ncbi:MAG: hypothetical protein HY767_00355 [Candidatus Omnitrophica bacterium]|nr:hypothetical protein [Candidatus Omnitrophota bacterium]